MTEERKSLIESSRVSASLVQCFLRQRLYLLIGMVSAFAGYVIGRMLHVSA